MDQHVSLTKRRYTQHSSHIEGYIYVIIHSITFYEKIRLMGREGKTHIEENTMKNCTVTTSRKYLNHPLRGWGL